MVKGDCCVFKHDFSSANVVARFAFGETVFEFLVFGVVVPLQRLMDVLTALEPGGTTHRHTCLVPW